MDKQEIKLSILNTILASEKDIFAFLDPTDLAEMFKKYSVDTSTKNRIKFMAKLHAQLVNDLYKEIIK